MVPDQQLKSDVSAIQADLLYMTDRWHELPEPALIEIRMLAQDKKPLVLALRFRQVKH